MSGGSWDYVYHRIEEAARRLSKSPDPNRRALGAALYPFSEALYLVEMVDSGDSREEDERGPIQKALGPRHRELVLAQAVADARLVIDQLTALCDLAEKPGGIS